MFVYDCIPIVFQIARKLIDFKKQILQTLNSLCYSHDRADPGKPLQFYSTEAIKGMVGHFLHLM